MQARQGDLWFESVEQPAGKCKNHNSAVLAYGEVTGHAHKITSPPLSDLDMVSDEKGDIFVKSESAPIEASHEEHGTVTLPPGEWFKITRQREYDPLAAEKERQVQD
jgi:hypothetical protein